MGNNQKVITGKEQAKINQRQRFYNKFLRKCISLSEKNELDTIIPLTMNKQFVFPEYDDLSLLFMEVVKENDVENEVFTKDDALALPFLDEGYYFAEKVKSNEIELLFQETLEDEDGAPRKGSTGAVDDYNYQKAYNWGFRILNAETLKTSLEKEIETPTEYKIVIKMKKIPHKRRNEFTKPWKPFRRRR